MAAAVDIDTKEIEFCIRGLLVSRPTVAKANVLQRECEEELGKPFPLRQLGVPTFLDYLRSIPNVVQLQPHNGYNPDVYPVASRASSHIDQLVSRQRVTRPRRRGVARQSAYGSRATSAPVRRRPSRVVSRSFPSVVRSNQHSYSIQSREFRSQSVFSSSSKNGVNVRDFERHMRSNYDERDLTRNGIQNVGSLLSQAEGIVEQSGTKVYPKFPSFSENTDRGCHNGIPAGYEDDLDDFDDVSDFYEEEVERDSEEEMSKQAIQLWTKALGVQEKDSSMRPPGKEEETGAGNSRESTHYEDQMYSEPEDDSNISKKMIDNFRKILNEYPDGIWASELPALYFDQFHVQLNALELGYSSMIGLVSNLPNVFSFKKVGSHDWKVYDARYIAQENLDSDGNLSTENGRFIPQTIIENIKKLLVNNSNGFKSIDLLKKYQETFRKSLDLESLGFHTLEEFLEILKNHITLKKGLNCYILLPKHTVVSHEAMEPPKPDERLNVPAESLCVPVPINVMRLGEEIPLQELPPVQDDPLKPLLELEVRVAEVMSPVFFYITLSSMYEEMESMMDDLHKFYEWEQENLQIPLPHFAVGLYCAAKYGEFWHRAKISRIMSNGDIGIEYIDYGTPKTVKNSELRYLSKEFTTLPTQAICAKLIGVRPVDEKATQFPTSACQNFLGLVLDKRLVAHVYEVGARVRFRQERMQLELILFDVSGKEEIVINDYLIDNGFASPITQIQDVPTEIDDVVENFEEYELTSLQTNGSTTPLPLSESPLLPENGLPENTISFPASSVNLYSNISPTLKLYVISRFAVRDSTKAQQILYKYTAKCSEEKSKKGNDEKQSCDPSTFVRNGLANGLTNGMKNGLVNGLKSDLASGLKNGLTNGLKNGLTNGSMIKHVTLATDGPKQDSCHVSDSIDVNPILVKIKKKQLNCLFGPVKPIVTQVISKLEPTCKENLNTVNSLNSSVLANGTLETSLNNFTCKTPKSSLPEKLNTVEDVANNITANTDNDQSLNGFENPNNTQSERKLDLDEVSDEVMVSHVSQVEPHLNISDINDKITDSNLNKRKILGKFHSEEIDLKAILEKTKSYKLKNLFVKPILPK